MTEQKERPEIEFRGGDGIEDLYIGGKPVGTLLTNAIENSRENREKLDRIHELEAIVQEQRNEIADLQRQVSEARAPDGGQELTKVQMVKDACIEETIRIADRGEGDGHIDVETAREIVDRQHAVDVHPETVRQAWGQLVDEWVGFYIKNGQPGPHTPNKRLKLAKGDFGKTLREHAGRPSRGEDE